MKAFSPGQAYVALSRAASVEGLELSEPIQRHQVKFDPKIQAFYKNINAGAAAGTPNELWAAVPAEEFFEVPQNRCLFPGIARTLTPA